VEPTPTPDAVRGELERILASEPFANAGRLSRLLRYVVERTLAGEGDQLKEYVLGLEVFDRDERYDPRLDSIVRVEARRLRAKLDEYYRNGGAGDPLIISLPKGGYVPIFGARVTEEAPAPPLTPVPPPAVDVRRFGIEKRAWPLVLAAIVAAAVGLAAWGYRVITTPPAAPPAGVTIAVLPFEPYSADANDQMLAGRITDGVTNELARLGTLGVVSRTSTLQFAGTRRPLRDIAQALDATLIMEGTITPRGDRLRVTPRVVDAAIDRKVWIEDFDGTVDDLPELHRRIAAAVDTAVANYRRRQPGP
jgi:TolB-like protein